MSLDAILGGLSIGSSVATGILGNQAAGTQADAALNATTQANALQKYIYDNNTKIAAPWLQQGGSSVNRLGWLLGLPGAQQTSQVPQSPQTPGVGVQNGNQNPYPTYPSGFGYDPNSLLGGGWHPGINPALLGSGSTNGNGVSSTDVGSGPYSGPTSYGNPNTVYPPAPNNPYDQYSQDGYGPNPLYGDGYSHSNNPPLTPSDGNVWNTGLNNGGIDLGKLLNLGGGSPNVTPGGGGSSAGSTGGGGGGNFTDYGYEGIPLEAVASARRAVEPPTPAAPEPPAPAQLEPTPPVTPATPTSPATPTAQPAVGATDSPYGTASEFGSLNHDFGTSDLQTDPGYQWRVQQGQKALEHSAASRGSLFSGGTMKALSDYNQNSASQEFGNAYNRFQINRTNKINPLLSLAGLGQQSAQQVQNAGTNYANNAGANTIAGLTGAANAQASGYASTANAINGASGGISNLLLLRNLGIG